MKDKVYIENTCYKCLNRMKDNDLCNIQRRIDNSYNCINADCIEIEEYFRKENGLIAKVKDILTAQEEKSTYIVADVIMCSCFLEDILKHSKNILDLVEKGDILKIREKENIVYLYCTDISELKRKVESKEIQLLEILTKQQFTTESYKIKR